MLSTSEAASVPFGRITDNTEAINISYNMGTVIYRVIHDIHVVKPSRFQYAEPEDEDDLTGWVWLNGKKAPVETAYSGGVLIWKLAEPE